MNVEWVTSKLVLKAGETIASQKVMLNQGIRIVSAVSAPGKTGIVDLGLKENGNRVAEAMDISFWERANAGEYLNGFKPISYKGGGEVTIEVTTLQNTTEDLHIEVVFGIIKQNQSC